MSLSQLYDGLEELQSKCNCAHCDMGCPYYISGSYGKECAIDTVMSQVAIEITQEKEKK